jgi:hypothetical protein
LIFETFFILSTLLPDSMAAEFISFNFHYTLSRKIPFTHLSDKVANVNFVIENDSIAGFDITIQRPMELNEAQAESDAYAYLLSDLISIKSQKYTIPSLSGFEADDVNGNRHIQGGLKLMWDIEGAPANLDSIEQSLEKINSDKKQLKTHLSYLAKAIFLEHQQFPDHSIMEAFKIIENNDKFRFYYKYFALRNVLAHSPAYFENTMKYFLEYFDQNTFDYLKYDPEHNVIIINLNSDKTQNELHRLLKELLNQIKILLDID